MLFGLAQLKEVTVLGSLSFHLKVKMDWPSWEEVGGFGPQSWGLTENWEPWEVWQECQQGGGWGDWQGAKIRWTSDGKWFRRKGVIDLYKESKPKW